ncbi:hypothetical protein [Streptomyces sp. NPDC056938]
MKPSLGAVDTSEDSALAESFNAPIKGEALGGAATSTEPALAA